MKLNKSVLKLGLLLLVLHQQGFSQLKPNDVSALLKDSILVQANRALSMAPITVTAAQCKRSAGGKHDFYSEGDYWWPDPKNADSPYIQRDGMTNPQNFTDHRLAMIRFSKIVGTLSSAYLITKDEKYVKQAFRHINAWFVDTSTRMNPSLLYAQAIKGRVTGRGVGIIDMIQMMEVAQGIRVMQNAKSVQPKILQQTKQWFTDYLNWVNTHPYGVTEREAKNNHGTCWTMQVAVFATLTENKTLLDYCTNRFKTVLLPDQLAANGSFPLELKRTKPYGYSLFNLDAMVTLCQVLSVDTVNLWKFSTNDGRNIEAAINFMVPFVSDKSRWPFPKDVMYWDNWPVAQPFLLFGAFNLQNKDWYKIWAQGNHFPDTEEVIRNLPVRNPLIWLTRN
jgi:hypothetical protein